MKIEIWSDIACPWCAIGKRRFERALEAFEHRDTVDVTWRSFELDPHAPRRREQSQPAHLAAKYGVPLAQAQAMNARMSGEAAKEGLRFDLDHAQVGNTFDAHRLLHLALAEGGPRLQRALKETLLAAYFTRGESMGDHAVLAKVAADVGLDQARVAEVLDSDAYAGEVAADVRQAQTFGATGVPFFVIDRRYGISGAQPVEVFAQALRQAWADAHPAVQVLGGDTDGVCGPDGCTP